MKSGRLLKSFITLVIGFAVTVSSPAYSQAVVEVPGTSPPCTGDCTGGGGIG